MRKLTLVGILVLGMSSTMMASSGCKLGDLVKDPKTGKLVRKKPKIKACMNNSKTILNPRKDLNRKALEEDFLPLDDGFLPLDGNEKSPNKK